MSYVVINAITVPAGRGDDLAARFAGRAGMVDKAEGFERFELLRPADGNDRWLVMTTWRDQTSFEAWMSSQAFGQAHGAGGSQGGPGHGGGHPHGGEQAPVSTQNEIWAFTVEQRSQAAS